MLWVFQRALVLLALMVLYLVRTIFDNVLVWPISMVLELLGVRPRPHVVRTPESCFLSLEDFKFKPNYCEIGGLRIHYIDEGPRDSQQVVLCLHGEPSWSYLYRKMIRPLVKAGHRVIAPDFIGFGKSDKFTSMDMYTHQLHTSTLRQFIQKLQLRHITLVVQDWGGLTGLSVLPSIDHCVDRLVIMNTGVPPNGRTSGRSVVNFLTWRAVVMACGTYLPVDYIFKLACTNKAYQISDSAVAGYSAPFPSARFRAGVAKWPLLVPLSRSYPFVEQPWRDLDSARDFLKTWTRPALVMFSDKCFVTRGLDSYFLKLIPYCRENPDGCHITIRGAGHFLQEDCGEALAMHIRAFVAQ